LHNHLKCPLINSEQREAAYRLLAAVGIDDELSETPDELDELLDEIKAVELPKRRRRPSVAAPVEAAV
jgi:hypothetical protein